MSIKHNFIIITCCNNIIISLTKWYVLLEKNVHCHCVGYCLGLGLARLGLGLGLALGLRLSLGSDVITRAVA